MNSKSSRTEYGWPGHFCCADRCRFKRNTHIKYGKREVVVSTVGKMVVHEKFEPVAGDAIFETMVFESDYKDKQYRDANVCKQLDANRSSSYEDMDGNDMHERMVRKWMRKIKDKK